MIVFGIESSCDDTGVAVLQTNQNAKPTILANLLSTNNPKHSEYGGVVPEIASRDHMAILPSLTQRALQESNIKISQIDGIAVTAGPGLIGGLLVGLMFAKGLAYSIKKPWIGVNHLEAHTLTPRITEDVDFPFLLLLFSGGHCQIVIAEEFGVYKVIGNTIDDAIGECIDKIARKMGLGYPGGPIIEQMALSGDPMRFAFPKPLYDQKNSCNFSLSGLKTAVIREIERHQPLSMQDICDFSASVQYTICKIILNRLTNALRIFKGKRVVMAGGVSANQYLRRCIGDFLADQDMLLIVPPIHLSTDNGAMIAWAGYERLSRGYYSNFNLEPRARWPLYDI